MLGKMIAYQRSIEKLISENNPKTNWLQEREFFKTKFIHLQQERLIHLQVTLTIGLAVLIAFLASLAYRTIPLLILDAILMTLFVAYLLYYRKLENTAQSWYSLLDKLQQLAGR